MPGIIAYAFGLVWGANPRLVSLMLASHVAIAASYMVQLLAIRTLLAALVTSVPGFDPRELLQPIALLVSTSAVTSFASLFQEQQQRTLNEVVASRTAERIMTVAERAPFGEFESPSFQDELSRANSALERTVGVSATVLGLVRGLSVVTGIAAAVLFISPILLGLIFVAYVPLWIVLTAVGRSAHQFFWTMTPTDRKRGYVGGLFSSRDVGKEVRTYAFGAHLRRMYRELSFDRLTRLEAYLRNRRAMLLLGTGVSVLLHGFAIVLVLVLLSHGLLTVADAGAVAAAGVALAAQLQATLYSVGFLYESGLVISDLRAFLARPAPVSETTSLQHGPPTSVRLENVFFTYRQRADARPDSAVAALKGVTIDIAANEVVALVGENGSGKTTIAKILSGLLEADRGRVLRDGEDITHQSELLRSGVAVLFQDFARFALTARDNIGFGDVSRVRDDQAIELSAARAGVDSLVDQWPDRYETPLGALFAGGRELSFGEWQRLALARAFFRDAPLVILDEPTASLDARAEHDLFRRMREILAGRSVLLISHRFSSVRWADRIYVLDHGAVVENGTHAELLRLRGVYAELFEMQASAYLGEDRDDVGDS